MGVNNFALIPGKTKIATALLTSATGATSLGPTDPTNTVNVVPAGETTTFGPNGGKLRRVKVVSQKATASIAKMVRLYYFDGTSWILFYEFEIAAGGGTPSATQKTKDTDWVDLDINFGPLALIKAASTAAEAAVVVAEIGDFEKQS